MSEALAVIFTDAGTSILAILMDASLDTWLVAPICSNIPTY